MVSQTPAGGVMERGEVGRLEDVMDRCLAPGREPAAEGAS